MKRIVVVILIITQLISCIPLESDHTPYPSSTSDIVGTPVSQGAVKMGEAVIIYQRDGGFAGVSEAWKFYPDGRVVSTDGTEYHLNPERVSGLLGEIANLGFFEMSDPDTHLSDCRDCFTHQLTARSNGNFNSVTAVDGTPNTPDQFWTIVEKINEILLFLVD